MICERNLRIRRGHRSPAIRGHRPHCLSEQAPREDHTAASQRILFDNLAATADLIESFAICLKEAARRDDRQRVHSYLGDIFRCVADARGAYGRVSDLVKLEARQ